MRLLSLMLLCSMLVLGACKSSEKVSSKKANPYLPEQLQEIEDLVNEEIRKNTAAQTDHMTYDDAIELMQRVGKSRRARQSMIRHLFRFLMGRNERLNDSRTLVEAERAYVDAEGSFRALVVSLLSSDSFLYRR